MNIISFSIFGNKEIYLCGAVENSKIAKEIYPEFKARFYADSNVNKNILKDLIKRNCEVVLKVSHSKWDGLFWRFEPIYDKNVRIWISRDCDSRLNEREAEAVTDWLNSNKTIHVMRDAVNHSYPIMAGMFGVNNSKINRITKLRYFASNKKSTSRESDQEFLAKTFWKWYKNDALIHDHWKFNLPNKNIKKHPNDILSPETAYGCGVIEYIQNQRNLRHPELFPDGSEIKPFKTTSSKKYEYYVGAQFDCNNCIIESTDARWELQLRK
jgi:hypothetical protein